MTAGGLILREARAEDARALAELWNPWIRDTAITFNPAEKTPAEIAAMIEHRQALGHAFVLAETEGADPGLLGFASYSQFRPGPGYAQTMEHTVILAAAARGRGVGRALMAHIEAHARAAGAARMIAAVSGENPAGRAFHEALGYRLVGEIPGAGWKFGRAMDLWLLARDLTAPRPQAAGRK